MISNFHAPLLSVRNALVHATTRTASSAAAAAAAAVAGTATSPKRSFRRHFHSSMPARDVVKNRIYTSIRNEEEFTSLLLLSASSRTPLITLWTASWCPSCRTVSPLLKELIEGEGEHIVATAPGDAPKTDQRNEADGAGGGADAGGGLSYAEVEVDSPTIGDLPMRYIINSIPTLLAFSRHEAQLETRVTSVEKLKDRDFLLDWLQTEARRGGAGGAGGSLFGDLFKR